MLFDLLEAAHALLPHGARPGRRARLEHGVVSSFGTQRAQVTLLIDPRGRRREQIRCDGRRMARDVALRLTCTETACPQARDVQARWKALHDIRDDAAASRPPARVPVGPAQLMQERPFLVAGHRGVARPAVHACRTHCPNRAHPPLMIHKAGFDVFLEGLCIGGGVVATRTGHQQPRLPTMAAAEAHVFARHLEAASWLAASFGPAAGRA